MKDGGLVLRATDERRIEVLIQHEAGLLSGSQAASLLGVGERQLRRLLVAYRKDGPRGIVHGNRGRPPAHALREELRLRVAELARGPYAGVNHSHLAELLSEREGIVIPRSTLSDILRLEGLRSPRPQRRRARHRSRRERYPQEGMLLQADASHHDWLQGRGPRLVLLGVIDDATGKVPAARFEEVEDAAGYLRLMHDLCRKTGVPEALYTDKHGVFWATKEPSLKEQLSGRQSTTQFGRAMAELGVALIPAHSPQAKGRVERLWGTLQDRLVSELRLANVSTIDQANAYLPGFLSRFNRTFAVPAEVPGSAYRPRRKSAELDTMLCFKHERVVAKDNTVKLDQMVFQLLPGPQRIGYTKATVTIHETLSHRFSVHFEGRLLPSRLVTLRRYLTPKPKRHPSPHVDDERLAVAGERPTRSVGGSQPALTRIPPPEHPWRRPIVRTKSPGT